MQQVVPRVLLAVLVLVLGGCAGGGRPGDGAASVPGATTAPSGVDGIVGLTASLYQTRMDVAVGQVQVQLTNGSDTGFTVRGLTLSSPGFESPMVSPHREIVIGPGRAVDLAVPLGEAVCPGEELKHLVQLDYGLEDGSVGSTVLPTLDQGGRIAELHAQECFAADVAGAATLTVTGLPQERELEDALVADLHIAVSARDGSGALDLVRVHNTTLLQLLDPVTGERQLAGYALDKVALEPSDAGPPSLVLTVAPARCDAHAVAEDKQGTRLRFDVVLDGREGTVTVPAPREVTVALYDFVRRACSGSTS